MGNEFADEALETTIMGRYPKSGTLLLEKYLVETLIGEGGMGCVIKAKHLDLDEYVAIKCLLPEMMDRKEIVARFIREAKAAVKLKGEHVARVLDVGKFPETMVPYIVMEYLEGADLNAIIKHHGSQDPSIATDLMLQACEGIAEAHSLGIIHRDIKASNFFITQPPNQAPILKVLDFGIATAPEGTSDLTSTQSVIGTPSYMAPEQMRSSRTADQRSDIWSIGVVLYELLEGARPFRSDVYSELCLKVGMDPPVPMINPDVPDGLRQIVMRCLEKPMEKRYQTVSELAYDLMPYASDPVAARASVEQCARLLGRRGSRIQDVVGPEESGPNRAPRRITPPGEIAIPSAPISSSQPSLSAAPAATVLGRPTPMPSSQPKTPTSIGASSGQISQVSASQSLSVKPRRSGLVVAITAVTVLALVGGGAYLASSQGWFGTDRTIAPASVTDPLPTPPEPTKDDKAGDLKGEVKEVKDVNEAKPDDGKKPDDKQSDTKPGDGKKPPDDNKQVDTKPVTGKPDDVKKPDDGKKPDVQKPIVQKPIVQKPIVQKPIVQKPIVQKPPAGSGSGNGLYDRRK